MDWSWIRDLPRNASPGRVLQYGSAGVGLVAMPAMLYSAARAPRGEKVGTFAAVGSSLAVCPGAAGAAALTAAFLPGIGPVAAMAMPFVAAALAYTPASRLEQILRQGVRTFNQWEKSTRRLECGGDYRDTELASNQRRAAISEMNSALVPARRVLGQEALLMHR